MYLLCWFILRLVWITYTPCETLSIVYFILSYLLPFKWSNLAHNNNEHETLVNLKMNYTYPVDLWIFLICNNSTSAYYKFLHSYIKKHIHKKKIENLSTYVYDFWKVRRVLVSNVFVQIYLQMFVLACDILCI